MEQQIAASEMALGLHNTSVWAVRLWKKKSCLAKPQPRTRSRASARSCSDEALCALWAVLWAESSGHWQRCLTLGLKFKQKMTKMMEAFPLLNLEVKMCPWMMVISGVYSLVTEFLECQVSKTTGTPASWMRSCSASVTLNSLLSTWFWSTIKTRIRMRTNQRQMAYSCRRRVLWPKEKLQSSCQDWCGLYGRLSTPPSIAGILR